MSLFDELMDVILNGSDEEFETILSSEVLPTYALVLSPQQLQEIIIEKNIRRYGDVNDYIASFVDQTVTAIATMAEGSAKEATKRGQLSYIEKLLSRDDISEESRSVLEGARVQVPAAAPAAGGRRRRRGSRHRRTLKKSTRRSGKRGTKNYRSK